MIKTEDNIKSPKKMFVPIIIAQSVCVIMIIAGVVTAKFLDKNTYKKITDFFGDKMCEQTDINEFTGYFKDAV